MSGELYNSRAWRQQLDHIGLQGVADQVDKPRTEREYLMQALGFPRYASYTNSIETFLKRDQVRDISMKTPTLWTQIIPGNNDMKKITELDITDKEIVELVASLSPSEVSSDSILVSEFLPNKFGGQMVVGVGGQLEVHFGEGEEREYSAGNKVPTHFAWLDDHGNMKYSFEDTAVREAVWRLISGIAKSADNVHDWATPVGYYEFALVGDSLRPIVLDYRPDKGGPYQLY